MKSKLKQRLADRKIEIEGLSGVSQGHYHKYMIFDNGDGFTTFTSTEDSHIHEIRNGIIQEADNHSHELGRRKL